MENKDYQKRVAAIHDLSGFGKCSLTVALPILSAAGIEACAMPTAILSTHTGGISGYTYRDLTSDMRAFMQHWKSLDIQFDATYSGFLGSFEQLDLVKEFFELFRSKNNLILVDPVMADNGELYRIFQPEFATGMRSLCRKADIIVPNLTEAALLLEESYHPGPYTQAYIEKILKKLSKLGPKKIVLTGVYFEEKKLGAATYDQRKDSTDYLFSERIPGSYHGTGDVFASALLSGLLNNFSLSESAQIAVNFTADSIRRTYNVKTDYRFTNIKTASFSQQRRKDIDFFHIDHISHPLSVKVGDQVSLVDEDFPILTLTSADRLDLTLLHKLTDGMLRKSLNDLGAFLDCEHLDFVRSRCGGCLRNCVLSVLGELNKQFQNVVNDFFLLCYIHGVYLFLRF